MLAQLGDDGGGHFVAAVLFARCVAASAPADAARFGARAVACLRHAIDTGEVPAAAAAQAEFTPLRARADYTELLPR
jgi:hypothetical protein